MARISSSAMDNSCMCRHPSLLRFRRPRCRQQVFDLAHHVAPGALGRGRQCCAEVEIRAADAEQNPARRPAKEGLRQCQQITRCQIMRHGVAPKTGLDDRTGDRLRALRDRGVDEDYLVETSDPFGIIHVELVRRMQLDVRQPQFSQALQDEPADTVIRATAIAVTEHECSHGSLPPRWSVCKTWPPASTNSTRMGIWPTA